MPIVNKDILGSTVATPAAGNTTIFTDASLPYIKDSTGTITPIKVGSGGGGGTPAGSAHNLQFNYTGYPTYTPAFTGSNTLNFYPGDYGNSMLTVGNDPNSGAMYDPNGAIVLGGSGSTAGWGLTNTYNMFTINQNYVNAMNPGTNLLLIEPAVIYSSNAKTHIYGDVNLSGYMGAPGKTYYSGNGTATLSGGTATVSVSPAGNTQMLSPYSIVMLTVQALGTVTVPQAVHVTNIVDGTPYASTFDIVSADPTDTSTVAWFIIN